MTIPKTAKCLEENRRFLVLKTGGINTAFSVKKTIKLFLKLLVQTLVLNIWKLKNVKHGSN